MIEHLYNLPMTQMEEMLKKCLSLRPDLRGRVLTSGELSDYITWLVENFGKRTDWSSKNVPVLVGDSDLVSLADRIMGNPSDAQALSTIVSGFEKQSEERYILSDHDISVARMFRYMPSHWHTNSYFEVYYVFSGSCPIHFSNETVVLKPGSVMIVAPSVVHASPCYRDDCVLMYYNIRSSTFDQVFWNQLPTDNLMSSFFRQALSGQLSTSYLHFETGSDEYIKHTLFQIYQEHQQEEQYRSQMINTLMSAFFILLLRRYAGTAKLPRTEDFYWKHEFSAILNFIQTNYATASIADVASHFHYSRRQISRIVQNCIGMTYSDLVLKLRMEKAAKLILQKNVSIDAIATAVGYSTPSSFYRAFTKYYGCTPKAYQNSVTS